MIFTVGNIITLVVAVLLILVFRQLDSNNRSLEKVKKFSEKLKSDLDVHFDQRSQKLQDMVVDLEVQQTQAIATVKRLDKIKEDFFLEAGTVKSKTDEVLVIGDRIAQYDTVLKSLTEMTANAEENLRRLTAESKFADSLQKKLYAAQEQLDHVDAAIPVFEERFAEINQNQLERSLEKMLDIFEPKIEEAAGRMDKIGDTVENAFAAAALKADKLEHTIFEKLQEKVQERYAKYQSVIEEKTIQLQEMLKARVDETQNLAKAFRTNWKSDADSYLQTTRAELSGMKEQIEIHFQKEQQLVEEKAGGLHELLKTKIEEVRHIAHDFKGEWKTEADEYLEKTHSEMSAVKELVKASALEAQESVKTFKAEWESDANTYLEKTRFEMGDMYTKAKELDSKLSAIFADYESQLQAYQKDVLYRFDRLDAVSSDTEQLESELRRTMDITSGKITAVFERFSAEQKNAQEQFESTLQDEEGVIRQRMTNLETDLNDLKAKAYGNVSQNLKVFEDDFFADLTKRSDAINLQLKRWKTDIDDNLTELATETEDKRREVERQYAEHLKEKLNVLNEKYREQTERIEQGISVSEENIHNRISSSDSALHTFIEQYRIEFEHARASSEEFLKNEFESHTLTVQEQLRKQERDVAGQVKDLNDTILAAQKESSIILDGIRDETSVWKTRVDQQFADTKEVFAGKLDNLDAATNERIGQIAEHFSSEYANYTAKAEAGYNGIVSKLQDLQTLMDEATESFDKRSKSANADFEKTYSVLLDDVQNRMREANAESDTQLRTLKSMVQEIREKTEATQDKIVLKMQTDINMLTGTLDDIDKRIKQFTAQTQLFDRADELKDVLEGNLAELKGEVSKVENYRQTLTDIEQQFTKIRKLEDELSQKMARFFDERKRLEILEGDFNKLIALSSSMDKKISELTTTSDDLQVMQMNVRRFQEALTEVSARYERLEKKNEVLDQTVLGVDKAFESLKAMEKTLQSYAEQANSFPAQVVELKRGVEQLLDNEKKVRTVVAKLDGLDKILLDTEKRTENMQMAREWLARTETRMQEVSKEAQEQVKLLGDLLKNDGAAKKDRGAPPPSIRETVTKLAHSGWKIDEIARTTKLSRGEVELILELNPDK